MEKAKMKFHVLDEAHSKAIQEKLFSLGYNWAAYGYAVMFTHEAFLLTEPDGLLHNLSKADVGCFNGCPNKEHALIDGEFLPLDAKGVAIPKNTSVKSDGGSSSYYQLTITNKAGESIDVETGDILRALVGNDYDLSNIVKACRRMYEASQGRGKEGASIEYDANKIVYFANEYKHWNK